jgi:antitoxin VapB
MPLNIRDPRASELARGLAEIRGTNMTEAVISALENEITRERAKPPLAQRVRQISDELIAGAAAERRKLTKSEIDKMWGN